MFRYTIFRLYPALMSNTRAMSRMQRLVCSR